MQEPTIIEKCKTYNPITESGHCRQYCLPGGCPYVHPQQSQWYEAIPRTSPPRRFLQQRPVPVPSAPDPQNNVPVAIPAPGKDEAMETDRLQNGNRRAIMTAEIYSGLNYLEIMPNITSSPSLELPTHSPSAPLQAQEPPPTANAEGQVASSSSISSNAFSTHIRLILQYTGLSITAPALQGHLQTIKLYHGPTSNVRPSGAKQAWEHDYKLADTKLAALNTMRSDLVKELVKSDASQALVDRRQRLEEGVTALRVAELLKKVEAVRKRIEVALQRKQEVIAKQNTISPRQPASPRKLNRNSPEVIDVDLDAVEAAPPTRRWVIEDTMQQVETLANEVEDVADFMDIDHAKVGEEVERLIPAWEAVKKDRKEVEERKDVGRIMTELAEAIQAVRDGVETVQSITMYAEQTDADEEAEMAKLRKEMTLLQRERKIQQADLQKVRSEIENAQWELPASVDQDEFISDIRARVERFLQPLFDQLEAAETRERQLFKEACNQGLEEKRMAEEAELHMAVADGRRRTNELIANAISTVAMVKKDVRESKRRQEAKQASQWGASVNGQTRA